MSEALGTISGDTWTSNHRIYQDLKTGEMTRVHPGSARVVCQRSGESMPLAEARDLGLVEAPKSTPEATDHYSAPTTRAGLMAELDGLGVKYLKKTKVADLAKLLKNERRKVARRK